MRTLMIYQHIIIPTLIFSKISNESPLLSRGLHPRASQSSKYRKTENYNFKLTVLTILTTLFNYCTYVKRPTNKPRINSFDQTLEKLRPAIQSYESSWFYLSVTQKGRFESTVPNGPNGPLLNLGAFKN